MNENELQAKVNERIQTVKCPECGGVAHLKCAIPQKSSDLFMGPFTSGNPDLFMYQCKDCKELCFANSDEILREVTKELKKE